MLQNNLSWSSESHVAKKGPSLCRAQGPNTTTHSVTAGVLSSNMGPTGPQPLRQQCSHSLSPNQLCHSPWVVFRPCPLTPGDWRRLGGVRLGKQIQEGWKSGSARWWSSPGSKGQTAEMKAKAPAVLVMVC